MKIKEYLKEEYDTRYDEFNNYNAWADSFDDLDKTSIDEYLKKHNIENLDIEEEEFTEYEGDVMYLIRDAIRDSAVANFQKELSKVKDIADKSQKAQWFMSVDGESLGRVGFNYDFNEWLGDCGIKADLINVYGKESTKYACDTKQKILAELHCNNILYNLIELN